MKKILFFCGLIIFPIFSFAQKGQDKVEVLDSIVVSANRASKKTPIANTTMSKTLIRKSSPTASIPLLLKFQPSVIATTEAGSAVGNTSLSVRGSDATRINVTLNGVAMNDAESQAVFWVNIPALTGFLQSVQLQRGIGTSSNGPGAFGASINMQTLYTAPQAYGNAEASYGSFNTSVMSIGAGSGLTPSGFSFDIRYARSNTDGYIRNGKALSNSLYASLGYKWKNNALKVNYILGDQHTGITWEGISRDQLKEDRTYNPAGEYYDEAGNVRYYDNETDNYTQHYVQAFYSHQFSSKLLWVNTFNFTKGDGYYENYKADAKFKKYALENQTIDGVEYKKSDFIIRQMMDNQFYVGATSLKYNDDNLRAEGGLSYSFYDGDHFGKVLWSKYNNNIEKDFQWYKNNGTKWETNLYARGEYDFNQFTFYADLQYRHIDLDMSGHDKDEGLPLVDYQKKYNFFNPKAGVTFNLNDKNNFYFSFAMGHKEPSRSDIKEAIKSNTADRMKSERLFDYEFGYKLALPKFGLGVNFYFMEYDDQLVATGKLSEVGYSIKENVKDSYRRGIELSLGWQIIKMLRFDANMTLSKNIIKNYTIWNDMVDNPNDWNYLAQESENLGNVKILMSPEILGKAMFTLEPFKGFALSLDGQYVGKQYYDNTQSEERSLPGYFLMGANASYKFDLRKDKTRMSISLFGDNLLNNKYVSNAWVYRALFKDGSDAYVEEGLFPQAPINFMLKLGLEF